MKAIPVALLSLVLGCIPLNATECTPDSEEWWNGLAGTGEMCDPPPPPPPPTPNSPEPRPWHDPDQDLKDAGFQNVPGKKKDAPVVPSQTTWFDRNEGYEDAGCVPASESAACESCLYSAEQQAGRDESACERQHERDEADCYANHDNTLEQGACLDAAQDAYDSCLEDAEDDYLEAEVECDGVCTGDC